MPEGLPSAIRTYPASRHAAWWITAGEPDEDFEEYQSAAANDTGKVHLGSTLDSATPTLGVGMAWDIKRGGGEHDVRSPAAREALWKQLARTNVTWWAPECRSFSRARGRPIPGAASWPGALRSEELL